MGQPASQLARASSPAAGGYDPCQRDQHGYRQSLRWPPLAAGEPARAGRHQHGGEQSAEGEGAVPGSATPSRSEDPRKADAEAGEVTQHGGEPPALMASEGAARRTAANAATAD